MPGYYLKKESFFPDQLPIFAATPKLFDDYVYQPKWNFTISGVKRAPITPTKSLSPTENPPLTPGVGNPYGVPSEFVGADGRLIYPEHATKDGFLLGIRGTKTLQPGDVIDRFGGPGGTFASPDGVPFPQRALPTSSAELPYVRYRVVQPFEVDEGLAAPWFGQSGGGVQYKLPDSIGNLLGEFLEIIP